MFSRFEQLGLRILGRFPSRFAQAIVPRVQRSSGLNYKIASSITSAELIANRLGDYRQLHRMFPAAVIGVAQGGATAHLARLLCAPFLPQAFVLTLRGGSPHGDAQEYFQLSKDLAAHITNRNPEFISIQHFDPVHDGWLTRSLNHLRLKLIEMPDAYRSFIRSHVVPGGDVVYLDGGATWLRQKVGLRNYYQAGGWGAISAQEFYYGSQRLEQYSAHEKLTASSWRLPDFDIESGPESEWGSEDGLAESLEEFCLQEGYRFCRICFESPNQFSLLAFLAYQQFLVDQGIQPSGVVVEMFSQFDPSIVHLAGLLPIWLIFNTRDSLEFLNRMLTQVPVNLPVFFSALSTFSNTPDMVNWDEWTNALAGWQWINAGARGSHYPADTLALLDWKKPLQHFCSLSNVHPKGRLTGDQMALIAERINQRSQLDIYSKSDRAVSNAS
ncbi:MAG TPA: hypothetical protein VN452_05355 [Longilinea sp.]|nr:hypothetical protein [Longilinea sp.]